MSRENETQRSENLPWGSKSVGGTDVSRQELDDQVERTLRENRKSERNPFVAFKTFIDDNFRAIWGLPSNILELKARMQQETEARRQHELETWRRWTGNTMGTPDHAALQRERASDEDRHAANEAAFMLFVEASRRNDHVPQWKLDALFKDEESHLGELDHFASPMLSFGGACYYMPETGDNLPSTASVSRWPTRQPRWLGIDWFKKSPYSPVQLEAHLLAGQEGTKWRAAFEDLLSATLDKPMESRDRTGQRIPDGLPQSTYHGPGLDWMLSLQCRGILPPQLPSCYNQPRGSGICMDFKYRAMSMKQPPYYTKDVGRDVYNEWQALVDEIATPSAPSEIDGRAHDQPATEQDLYDQLHNAWTQTGLAAVHPCSTNWHVPIMTGDACYDLHAVEEALFQAVKRNDSAAVGDVLDEYQSVYGEPSVAKEEVLESMFMNADKQVTKAKVEDLHRLLHDESWDGQVDAGGYQSAFGKLAERWYVRGGAGEEAPEDALAQKANASHEEMEELQLLAAENQKRKQILCREGPDPRELREHDRQAGLEQQREALGLPAEDGPSKPDILSQLTTTQTTRLPDGTITTKVVLNRRFADGKEETTETVETIRGQQEEVERKVEEAPNGKGWFWR